MKVVITMFDITHATVMSMSKRAKASLSNVFFSGFGSSVIRANAPKVVRVNVSEDSVEERSSPEDSYCALDWRGRVEKCEHSRSMRVEC